MAKILLVDLHNTVFDELGEYGPALDKALDLMLKAADLKSASFDDARFKKILFRHISQLHRDMGDDWDNRIFDAEKQPVLAALFSSPASYEAAREKTIAARYEFSKKYIQAHAYEGAAEFLKAAHAAGHRVFIVTDATEQAVHPSLTWLKLDGQIDGVYCCGSPNRDGIPEKYRLKQTEVTAYAQNRVKPDAMIVAQIVLDVAKAEAGFPAELELDDVFEVAPSDYHGLFGDNTPRYVSDRLVVKDTKYAQVLELLLEDTIGIGDDHRDLVLHLNAGIQSVKACYSKNIPNFEPAEIEAVQSKGKDLMASASGWSEERIKLFTTLKHDKARTEALEERMDFLEIKSLPELGYCLPVEPDHEFDEKLAF